MTRRAPSTFLLMLLLVLPHATTVLTSEAASASSPDPEELEDVNEVAVRLHQEVRLECVPPPGTASWRHDAAATEADGSHRYATLDSGHLRISSVRLDDVGLWSCERRDPQTGRPLPGSVVHRLSVTEPPHAVYLEVDGRRLDPGNVFLPVWEGAALTMGCVAEGGVPPPRLSWRLLVSGSAAGNAPLLSTQAPVQLPVHAHLPPHVVRSEARVERLVRAHHNASVACLVQHPAMHPPAITLSLLLDVQYSPSFAISRVPGFGYPLREGIPVSLKCDVDSNPASSPVWVKDDGPPPVAQSVDGYLNFSAISRDHVGWYKCTSRDASSLGYFLNVVYDDEVSEGSERASSGARPMADEGQQVEATLGSAVTLQCPGGACWRRLGTSGHLEPVGVGPELSLERVLYQEAGVYRCEADRQAQNQLDQRRSQLSVRLNVTGSPVVHPPNASVAASSGQRVTLRFEFCANPAADRAVWLLGSSLLKPGHVTDAAVAHNITEGSSPLCHEAALTLRAVTPADAGEYAFLVRSPRGLAEGSVSLSVMRASGLARAQHCRAPASSALLCCVAAILLSRA